MCTWNIKELPITIIFISSHSPLLAFLRPTSPLPTTASSPLSVHLSYKAVGAVRRRGLSLPLCLAFSRAQRLKNPRDSAGARLGSCPGWPLRSPLPVVQPRCVRVGCCPIPSVSARCWLCVLSTRPFGAVLGRRRGVGEAASVAASIPRV